MSFFLYILTFAGSEKVLENFSWGPGKSWISFVSKRVGTLQLIVFFPADTHMSSGLHQERTSDHTNAKENVRFMYGHGQVALMHME